MASSPPSKAFSSRIVHLQICLRLLQLMGSPIQSPDSQDVGGPLLLLSPPLLRHLGILLMGLSNGSWWSCNILSYLHGFGYCLLLLSSMTARMWMRYLRKCWSIFLGGLRVVFPWILVPYFLQLPTMPTVWWICLGLVWGHLVVAQWPLCD